MKKRANKFEGFIKLGIIIALLTGSRAINATTIGEEPRKNNTDVTQDLELNIESWMLNLAEWPFGNEDRLSKSKESAVTGTNPAEKLTFDLSRKDEINLECWMLDANNEFWEPVNNYLTKEAEDDIELETWMTDLSQW
ncbi:MAG: hypothetical protein JXA77_11575 [Bacteroidales bacterium]|nr:hypothetical protein [Bacteroidales bacterium]MBN2818774.1 hypothetical protein [Bacteroidales bacterium]